MTKRGKIIIFEGPEGSGKDTQIPLFENFLKEQGVMYKLVREPGTTEVGKKLREYLLHDKRANLNPIQEAVFFNASRLAMFIEDINPVLERGELAVFNRSFKSTLVYQIRSHEIAKEIDSNYICPITKKEGKIIEDMTLGVVKNYLPDLTYLLDVPVEIGMKRVGKNKDKIESRTSAYHEGVRRGYLELPRRFKDCVIIDATRDIGKIQEEVRDIYLKKFSN